VTDSDPERDELDNIVVKFLQALESGANPKPDEWIARHPHHAAGLAAFIADLGRFGSFIGMPTPPHLDDTVDLAGPRPPKVETGRFGDYEILGEVGRGAMGVVYRARLKGTNLVVALKEVRTGGDSVTAARRFRQEIEAASALRHPHIVPIFHVGEHATGPYYTMALIEGGSLEKHLGRFRDNRQATATLVAKVARAIHHAHQRQVLHRDLKPANVLLDEAGEPHVADFGLATRLDADGAATANAPAGSLPWMAPEAVRGDSSLSTAVDVWALGVILYELLTGVRPFDGTDRNTVRKAILDKEPTPPRTLEPKIDRDLDAICRHCLEKNPDERYESASALALDLDRWLRHEPVRARKSLRVERFMKWTRRNPAIASAGVFVLVMLVASTLAAFSVAREQEKLTAKEVCRGNEFAARHVASTLLGRLRQFGSAVEDASGDGRLVRACRESDWHAVEEFLRSVLLANPPGNDASPFVTAFVLDPEGVIRAESPQRRIVVGDNFAGRDYFRGAVARANADNRVHLSRVFTSKNDDLDKLAISVPFRIDDKGDVWVLGATVPTDATLGLGGLHDDSRKAVLLAPRDQAGPLKYVILVHPGYVTREPSVDFPMERLRADGASFAPDDKYLDPVAEQHPEFAGRWLAGFAPVPETELVVLVQQPYESAVAPQRTFFRRFLEWVAAAAGLASLVVVGIWLMRRRNRA
jgi:serine/threonine-protein kinase